jgi:hypothetical protein
LLRRAERQAFEILKNNRRQLDLLVEALLQREELTRDEIDELLRTGRLAKEQSPASPEPEPVTPQHGESPATAAAVS